MGPQAIVLGPAKAQMAVGVAADVEVVGVVEHRLVPVARGVEHHQIFALLHRLAGDFGVFHHRALHVVDRGGPADHFLHRVLGQLRVLPQPLELVGMLQKRLDRTRQGVAGGVVAGGEHDQVVAEGLDVAQGLAGGQMGMGQHGGQILLGTGPAILDDAVEHGVELHADFHAGLMAGTGISPVVGVVARQKLLGQHQQALLVAAVDAENGGQHPQRMALGDDVHEIALALVAQAVEQGLGAFVDNLVELADAPRGEEAAGHLAVEPMIGRVHADDGPHVADDAPVFLDVGHLLFGAHRDAVGFVAEHLGLGGNLDDVGVAGDGPEVLEAVGVAPMHGGVLAQPRQLLVGVAVGAVTLGADEVEGVDVHAKTIVQPSTGSIFRCFG